MASYCVRAWHRPFARLSGPALEHFATEARRQLARPGAATGFAPGACRAMGAQQQRQKPWTEPGAEPGERQRPRAFCEAWRYRARATHCPVTPAVLCIFRRMGKAFQAAQQMAAPTVCGRTKCAVCMQYIRCFGAGQPAERDAVSRNGHGGISVGSGGCAVRN